MAMTREQSIPDRRGLSRALSRISNASVADAMQRLGDEGEGHTRRIGITGAPGSGKSTLIASLAKARLARGGRIGVLAIDPSSPITHGSLLGDRIRMDAVTDHPGFYVRSVPSRTAHDGLSDNTADLLHAMALHDFDEVLLETVGVGQAEYAVKTLVDTVVLVLIPGSGDAIQAMKAGILETADIYVVNKADLPGAPQAASEIRAILGMRRTDDTRWKPRVLMVAQGQDEGVDKLNAAIDEHLAWSAAREDRRVVRRRRARYHLQSLIGRRVEELMEAGDPALFDAPLPRIFHELVRSLAQTLPAEGGNGSGGQQVGGNEGGGSGRAGKP